MVNHRGSVEASLLGKDGDVRANRSGTEEDWATRLARELGIVSFDPLSNQDGALVRSAKRTSLPWRETSSLLP
jgi:hypothetical protein